MLLKKNKPLQYTKKGGDVVLRKPLFKKVWVGPHFKKTSHYYTERREGTLYY